MTDFTTRTPQEAKALELLQISYTNHSTIEVMVREVFTAMWYASLPLHKIQTIAEAISAFRINDPQDLQKVLTKMTRAKILRSHSEDGRRFYEVNY